MEKAEGRANIKAGAVNNDMLFAIKKNNSGFIVIYTLLFMSVLLAIFGTMLNSALNELRYSGNEADSLKAFYAADTAIECVRYYQKKYRAFNTTEAPRSYNCGVGTLNGGGLSGIRTPTCQAKTYPTQVLAGYPNGACVSVNITVGPDPDDPLNTCKLSSVTTGQDKCGNGASVERIRWEDLFGPARGTP